MRNRGWWRTAAALLLITFILTACGARQPVVVQTAAGPVRYDTVGICQEIGTGIRVDDDLCPIGDGDVSGYPYRWVYADFNSSPQVPVYYVGQPIPLTVYHVGLRDPAISSLRINRGVAASCGCAVSSGQPPGSGFADRSDQNVAPDPKDTKRITRGGLGVQSGGPSAGTQNRVAASSPSPKVSGPRPTGTITQSKANAASKKAGK